MRGTCIASSLVRPAPRSSISIRNTSRPNQNSLDAKMFELGKVLQRMPSIMAHLASDHIIEHPTFKRALKKIMDDGYCGLRDDPKALDLLDHLREFFGRWRDNKTDDHLWERIAADAEHRGLSRTQSYYRIAAIAFEASLIAGHP